MMVILYNVLLHLIGIVLSPLLLILTLFNKYDLRQRLGYWEFTCDTLPGEILWFHAASMGEVTALATVVHEIKNAFPDRNIVISTTTLTGQHRAKELIPFAACIFLAPLDFPWTVNRVLRRLRPRTLILTETELWPNMILQAKRWGCKIGLVNGRMTEKSTKHYKRIKGLLQHILKCFDLLCVQTELDKDRFLMFGADRQRIVILGNMKFDLLRFLVRQRRSNLTKESLGIGAPAKVIVAGSTRPGEEQILLSSFDKMKARQGYLVLFIAPRHLDRIGEVEHILSEHKLTFTRRSDIDKGTSLTSGIILLDTMGELSQIYSFADVAFVGGSLVPCGGHNPLEPAMWGVPVLFGPHRDNVRQITNLLIEQKGGIEIQSGDELAATVIRLLEDADERKMRGKAALKVVEANSGVSTQTAWLLHERGLLSYPGNH